MFYCPSFSLLALQHRRVTPPLPPLSCLVCPCTHDFVFRQAAGRQALELLLTYRLSG